MLLPDHHETYREYIRRTGSDKLHKLDPITWKEILTVLSVVTVFLSVVVYLILTGT